MNKKTGLLLGLTAVACVGSVAAFTLGNKVNLKAENEPTQRVVRFEAGETTTSDGNKLTVQEYAVHNKVVLGQQEDGFALKGDRLGRVVVTNEIGVPFAFSHIEKVQVNYSVASASDTGITSLNVWVSADSSFATGVRSAYLEGTDGLNCTADFVIEEDYRNYDNYVSLAFWDYETVTVHWFSITYTC